jgi:hypothetical protein
MAHSEVEIVPVLDVEIRNCSQSVTPSAGIFPWTFVILTLLKNNRIFSPKINAPLINT